MTATDRPGHLTPEFLLCSGGFLFVAIAVVLVDLAMLMPGETLTREGGGIETMSMLGYLAAIGVYFWRRSRPPFWPVPVLLLLMAMREFDADKQFTSHGVLSSKILFYDTAIWEKTLAIGVWALLCVAVATLILGRVRTLLDGLRRAAPWALAFVAGMLLAAFSKAIDGLTRKLLSWGIEVPRGVGRGSGTLEELLELLIPVLFASAIFARARTYPEESYLSAGE